MLRIKMTSYIQLHTDALYKEPDWFMLQHELNFFYCTNSINGFHILNIQISCPLKVCLLAMGTCIMK